MSARIATYFDYLMLRNRGVMIRNPDDEPVEALPTCSGVQVAAEIAGRWLLYFGLPDHLRAYADRGKSTPTYVTPTPYTPEEAIDYLYLPSAHLRRDQALLLDQAAIPLIQGPTWVAEGGGIQFFLPHGFTAEAIRVPGTATGHWAVNMR